MKLILILSLFISFSLYGKLPIQQTSQIKCKLPSDQRLVIGCTNYCGRFNKWALKWYARSLGYKLKIVNLRSSKQKLNYTQVDGILIPGGSDIDPKWYMSKVTPEFQEYLEKIKNYTNYTKIGKLRDEFEFNLLEDFFSNPNSQYQPILGICRGMQVLTASQGIPLYGDIQKELGIKNRQYTLDKITITNPESLISELIGRKNFKGVELHHQGLNMSYFNKHRENWPQLEVTALSNGDKIAEALEFYDRPILGVQFHPEYTFGKPRRNIFKWLLKRACFNKVIGSQLSAKQTKDKKQ